MKSAARFPGIRSGPARYDLSRPDNKAGRGQALQAQEGRLSPSVVVTDRSGRINGGGNSDEHRPVSELSEKRRGLVGRFAAPGLSPILDVLVEGHDKQAGSGNSSQGEQVATSPPR